MTQCNCYCMHCIGYLRAKPLERAKCLEGCRDLMQEFSLYVFHSGDDGIHTHGTPMGTVCQDIHCPHSPSTTLCSGSYTHTHTQSAGTLSDDVGSGSHPPHVCVHANTIAALHVSEHYTRDQTCKGPIERDRCNVVMLNGAVSSACPRSFSSLHSLPPRLHSPSCLRTLPQHAECLQWRSRVC